VLLSHDEWNPEGGFWTPRFREKLHQAFSGLGGRDEHKSRDWGGGDETKMVIGRSVRSSDMLPDVGERPIRGDF